ncbi:TniQ family protein [Achromobacter insolitus]|uniref:TniQ family protein n=1 Tax=Achromobacter insolitus TaxID=217204 RepID=UPI0039C89C93
MLEPRLYLHAEPHVDESCASWLIRTSEIHGLTLQELFSALKVRMRRDVDLVVVPRVLRHFTRGMDYSIETLVQMTTFFQLFRTDRWANVWLKTLDAGVPGTGYCPSCLAADRRPYWRAPWRYRFWLICPEHCCWIRHDCPNCGAPVLIADYVALRPFVRGQSLCTTCARCGADLRSATCEYYHPQALAFEELQQLQRAMTAALLKGSFRLFGLDEDLPLALLPSVLVAGGTRASRESVEVSQAFGAEISAAAEAIANGGPPGIFLRNNVLAGAQTAARAWKGPAGRLANLALTSKFYPESSIDGAHHASRPSTNRLAMQCHKLMWGF